MIPFMGKRRFHYIIAQTRRVCNGAGKYLDKNLLRCHLFVVSNPIQTFKESFLTGIRLAEDCVRERFVIRKAKTEVGTRLRFLLL